MHAIPNAALIAAALTHADGDFTGSIAVPCPEAGTPTPTARPPGRVAALLTGGPAALPDRWTAPLKNRLATSVADFDGVGFDALAHLTGPSGGTPPMTTIVGVRQHEHGPRRLRRPGPRSAARP